MIWSKTRAVPRPKKNGGDGQRRSGGWEVGIIESIVQGPGEGEEFEEKMGFVLL